MDGRARVRLTPAQHLLLHEIAMDQGVSQAEVLRYALTLVAERHRKKTLAILPEWFVKDPVYKRGEGGNRSI